MESDRSEMGSLYTPSEDEDPNDEETTDMCTVDSILEALEVAGTNFKLVRSNKNKRFTCDKKASQKGDVVSCSTESSAVEVVPFTTVSNTSWQDLENNLPEGNEGITLDLPTVTLQSGLPEGSSYVEFQRVSVDSVSSLDEVPVHQFNSESQSEELPTVTRINSTDRGRSKCRSSIPRSKEWSRNMAKMKRMQGEEYIGYRRGVKGSARKVIHDVPKEERKMGPTCISRTCATWKTRLCGQVDEDERKRLFNDFWKNMSWDTKKMFVCSTVEISVPKRRYSSDNNRQSTFTYHLKINGEKIPVCQGMYLNTLGLKRSEVRYWMENYRDQNMPCLNIVKEKHDIGDEPTADNRDDSEAPTHASEVPTGAPEAPEEALEDNIVEQNGIPIPTVVTTVKEKYEFLNKFFDSIPKMPSHYCRKSTKRSYLQTDIRSWTQLYEMYQEKCHGQRQDFLSRFSFDKERKKCQLAIFKPKKDRCDTCLSYETGHVSQAAYESHITKKEEAQNEKQKDKEAAEKGELWAICFDLMNVQTAPKIRASCAYYKLKLTLHNFSVYNLASHDALLYWFDESEANLGASTFASCIVDFVLSLIAQEKKPVVLYSDGCSYQNRNAIVSSALLHVAVAHQVPITHKYLEKGHTHMEGDSVHSKVEGFIEDLDIYLPSQYATLSQLARRFPMPYRARYLDHTFFKNYAVEEFMAYKSIRPGKGKGDPTVMDIRVLLYNPNGTIYYKLNYVDEFKELPVRKKAVEIDPQFPPLFTSRQTIPKDKWEDLQSLKKFLTPDAHAFYDQLPHEKGSQRQERRSEKNEGNRKRKTMNKLQC